MSLHPTWVYLFLSLITPSLSLFSTATCKAYPYQREDEVFQVCAMHSLMNRSCGILGLPHRVFVHVDFVHADARLWTMRLDSLHPSPLHLVYYVATRSDTQSALQTRLYGMDVGNVLHSAAFSRIHCLYSKIDYAYV